MVASSGHRPAHRGVSKLAQVGDSTGQAGESHPVAVHLSERAVGSASQPAESSGPWPPITGATSWPVEPCTPDHSGRRGSCSRRSLTRSSTSRNHCSASNTGPVSRASCLCSLAPALPAPPISTLGGRSSSAPTSSGDPESVSGPAPWLRPSSDCPVEIVGGAGTSTSLKVGAGATECSEPDRRIASAGGASRAEQRLHSSAGEGP